MSAIHVDSDRFVCELPADARPAIEVPAGRVLRVHCRQACEWLTGAGPQRATAANPATGPIAVSGAEPGQALRIEVLDIVPESPGYISTREAGRLRAVPIEDGAALFSEAARIPVAPMIGVLGVAPAEGSWTTMECGPYGGNLDTKDIAPGAAVYLPVFQPGGLFVLGDVHAVMGDGEIGGQGLEVAAHVTLRVGIEREPLGAGVWLVRNQELMTLGTGETLDAAAQDAQRAMVGLLVRAGIFGEFDATKFLGLAGDLRVGQQCCRTKSARVAVPLRYLPSLRPQDVP